MTADRAFVIGFTIWIPLISAVCAPQQVVLLPPTQELVGCRARSCAAGAFALVGTGPPNPARPAHPLGRKGTSDVASDSLQLVEV